MDDRAVVTCFLRNRGDVLLLRRTDAVDSYAGLWGGVAGHVATDAGEERPPEAAARAEISEETGIDASAVTLVRAGEPFWLPDAELGVRWRVHPFLWDCPTRAVETNRETDEWAWIPPTAILRRATVPALWASYDRIRPRVATVRDDRDHGSAWLSIRALELLRDEAALASVDGPPDGPPVRREADGDGWRALADLAGSLLAARPSMGVVENRLDRAMATASEAATAAAVETAASEGIDRAVAADEQAAAAAAQALPERIATLSRSGTVRAAIEQANPDAVLVAESRPGREGVGVAERLAEDGDASVTLTTDAAFPAELRQFEAGALVVGADRVLPDGRVVNKVGTHGSALAARAAGIPCYVVAASDKVTTDGAVDREERDPTAVYDGSASLAAVNPTFDVTPADAVTAVVTERGVLSADGIEAVAEEHRRRAAWRTDHVR